MPDLKKKKKKTLFIFLYSRFKHNILYSKRFFLNNFNVLDSSKIDDNIEFIQKNFNMDGINTFDKQNNKSYFFTLFTGLNTDNLDIKDTFYFNKVFNSYFTSFQVNNKNGSLLHAKQFHTISS